jgi:hypothetical protein
MNAFNSPLPVPGVSLQSDARVEADLQGTSGQRLQLHRAHRRRGVEPRVNAGRPMACAMAPRSSCARTSSAGPPATPVAARAATPRSRWCSWRRAFSLVLKQRSTWPWRLTTGCVQAMSPGNHHAGDRRSRARNVGRHLGSQRVADLDHRLAWFSNGDRFRRGCLTKGCAQAMSTGKASCGCLRSRTRNIGHHHRGQRVGTLGRRNK